MNDFPKQIMWVWLVVMGLYMFPPPRDWWLRKFRIARHGEIAWTVLRYLRIGGMVVLFLTMIWYGLMAP